MLTLSYRINRMAGSGMYTHTSLTLLIQTKSKASDSRRVPIKNIMHIGESVKSLSKCLLCVRSLSFGIQMLSAKCNVLEIFDMVNPIRLLHEPNHNSQFKLFNLRNLRNIGRWYVCVCVCGFWKLWHKDDWRILHLLHIYTPTIKYEFTSSSLET